ncbi:MAG: BLUF domain-containing protein, partial [Rubrivivax sp.]
SSRATSRPGELNILVVEQMANQDGLTALVYVSSATGRLSDQQIDGILASSRRVNAKVQVTGTLLHHDGTFLQYLEGPVQGMEHVWHRVSTCRMHHDINVLLREPLGGRHFDQWHLGFVQAPATVLQALSQGRWRASATPLLAASEPSSALGVLLDFWRRSQGLQSSSGRHEN